MKHAVPAWNVPGQTPLSQVLRTAGARPPKPVAVGADDVAVLAYTGGTTGVSKAAVILYRSVVAHTDQVGEWVKSAVGRAPEDLRLITASPLYHAAALMTQVTVLPREGGCSILVANPRDLGVLINTLQTERFTVRPGINTLYLALLGHPEIGTVDFADCRLFAGGAMQTQKGVSDCWQALTGRPIIERYGLPEATGLVSVNPPGIAAFIGRVGLPTRGTEVAIRDEQGNALPADEHGEICVRGPQVMGANARMGSEQVIRRSRSADDLL